MANKVGMKELVNQMVEQYGYTKDDSEAVLNDLIGMIAKHVKNGNVVELGGVGSFAAVEERDANDRVTYRPVYTPSKAMREIASSRTRLATARERKYQKWAVKMICQMSPADAHEILNGIAPFTPDTETGLATLDTLSSYYGLTRQYIYGILYRFEMTHSKHPYMVRYIHNEGAQQNGYDTRVALALALLMCFGRKSVLNSRAKAVYDAVRAHELGQRAMEKAAKLDRAPSKRRCRKRKNSAGAAVVMTVAPDAAEAATAAGE